MLKVCKVGGSSLADVAGAEGIKRLVSEERARKIIVVSAPGKRFEGDEKTTDALILAYNEKDEVKKIELLRGLASRYSFFGERAFEFAFSTLAGRKYSSIAEFVSRGEYLSAKLLADYLGYRFVDAAGLVFVKNGGIDLKKTTEAAKNTELKNGIIVSGFYGLDSDGLISLLPRGGGDVSGSALAAAFGADAYENLTDVAGVRRFDPSIVKNPEVIPFLSKKELYYLSSFGMRAIQRETVGLLGNIPLVVRSFCGSERTVVKNGARCEKIAASGIPVVEVKFLKDGILNGKSGLFIAKKSFRACLSKEKIAFFRDLCEHEAFYFYESEAEKEHELFKGAVSVRRGLFAVCAIGKNVTFAVEELKRAMSITVIEKASRRCVFLIEKELGELAVKKLSEY